MLGKHQKRVFGRVNLGKFRVLIVEDELLVAADLKHHLESMGYVVDGIATTGIDAIKNTENIYPDLILMDVMLRGNMDGVDSAKIIVKTMIFPSYI